MVLFETGLSLLKARLYCPLSWHLGNYTLLDTSGIDKGTLVD